MLAVLVNEVHVVAGFEHLHEADDIRVLDLRQDFDLVEGELLEFGHLLEFVRFYHFYGV